MLQFGNMPHLRYYRNPLLFPHRLTTRDINILQKTDHYTHLNSAQIATLFGISRQAINKRLKLLFHNHYLGKLPAQLSPRMFNSSDVYFVDLDAKVRAKLVKKGIILPHRRRKMPKREHLQHTLLTNDIVIAFELAARENPDIEFVPSHQLLATTDRASQRYPWKVPAFLPERGITRSAYPDAAFAIHDKNTSKTQLYLIEADRMTEPIARNDKKLFNVSNIKAKLTIYHTAWQQGVFRERFGLPATRILFVTLSEKRAQNMQELADNLFDGRAAGLFIFTTIDSLNTNNLPL